jgi:hypothetical protein
MTAFRRDIPSGIEVLAPHLRMAARLHGCAPEQVAGPVLDIGEGAHTRCPHHGSDAHAWDPRDTPGAPLGWTTQVAPGSMGMVIAWPGPAALPAASRAAWWSGLSRVLRPGGVAAVRLDMLPGWHALTAVQDFARFHASRKGLGLEPAMRDVLSLAQQMIEQDEGAWHGWLSYVRHMLRDHPDHVPDLVRGPVHAAQLHTWIDEAQTAGLRWLGEARGPDTCPHRLGHALDAWIREEVSRSSDPLRGAQIFDYARNTHTRLVLLTKGAGSPDLTPDLSDAHVLAHADEPGRWGFSEGLSDTSAPIPTPDPRVTAVGETVQTTPGSLPMSDLRDALTDAGMAADDVDAAVVMAWRWGVASLRDVPLPAVSDAAS